MTSREKVLAIVIGAAILLGLGYKGVDKLFVQRIADARELVDKDKAEQLRLEGVIRSEETLARRWLNYAARTFSADRLDAQGNFATALKQMAQDHGFGDAVFSPAPGSKIGTKTDITTVAHRIVVQGSYEQVMGLLRDVYKSPFLCQITKLSILPLGTKAARGTVKADFTIESPVLPAIDAKKIPYARNARTMASGGDPPAGPARGLVRADEYYRLFEERNIFRSYLAPPENLVLVDNRDRKMVAVKLTSFWENKATQKLEEAVSGKSAVPLKVKGDVVEIAGIYADGMTFGPKRLTLEAATKSKENNWAYVIEPHSPPTFITVDVDNKSGDPVVFVEVVLTTEDNQQKQQPTVAFFNEGASELGVFENVKMVRATVKYKSGKLGAPKTFGPKEDKQTLVIPKEPEEFVKGEDLPPVAPPKPDDPADAGKKVTGLVYYPDPDGKNGVIQEMIATDGTGLRTIIRVGDEGAVVRHAQGRPGACGMAVAVDTTELNLTNLACEREVTSKHQACPLWMNN